MNFDPKQKKEFLEMFTKLGGAFGFNSPTHEKIFELKFKNGVVDYASGRSISDAWTSSGRNKDQIKDLESYRVL